MKITKIAMLIVVIAVALYVLFPNLSWAEDGSCFVRCSIRPFTARSSGRRGAGDDSAYKRQYQLRRGA